MKRSMAVLLAVAMGFMHSPPGTVALAEGNEEKLTKAEENTAESKVSEESTEEDSFIHNLFGNFLSQKEEEEPDREVSGLKNLQIPQKLDIVIDPWEIDRKGQIYSEQYIICNTGETRGTLTLSNLACRPGEQSGVIVRTDKEGLHDSGDKSVYMEMLFGNGEKIIFSPENAKYQTELKPGEELSVCFAGEVNENAFEKWENNDITVSVVYSWEIEEKQNDINMNGYQDDSQPDENLLADGNVEKEEEPQTDDNPEEEEEKQKEEPEEKIESAADEENPQESQNDPNGATLEEDTFANTDPATKQQPSPDLPAGEVNGQKVSETTGEGIPEANLEASTQEGLQASESNPEITEKEEEEIKHIELREPQKVDVVIDSWKIDEKGRIVSSKYILQNTGDIVGTWSFSDLICKAQEQSWIRICTDKKEIQDSDVRSVYLELVLGNGERSVVSQENSQYKVELKPGEALAVQFVGEMKGNLFENQEDGDIVVTAICTWNMEQTATE